MRKIKSALISVSDKSNLIPLLKILRKNNINFPERFFSKDQVIEPALIKNTYLSGGFGVKEYKNNYKNCFFFVFWVAPAPPWMRKSSPG